jgi:hypothetical protein
MRTSVSDHRHRFPTEIISHSVWLCFRFALGFRDVEEMMASRGVSLSYECPSQNFNLTFRKGTVSADARCQTEMTFHGHAELVYACSVGEQDLEGLMKSTKGLVMKKRYRLPIALVLLIIATCTLHKQESRSKRRRLFLLGQ